MLLAISVRSVQQALTQIARNAVLGQVAPRRIDGEWGTDTRNALLMYVGLTSLMTDADKADLAQRLASTGTPYALPRAHTIMLPDVLVVEFTRQASAYVRDTRPALAQGVDVPESMRNAERPSTVISVDPVRPTMVYDARTAQSSGSSPVLSIVLGLGAAAVLVGGGYLLMTR